MTDNVALYRLTLLSMLQRQAPSKNSLLMRKIRSQLVKIFSRWSLVGHHLEVRSKGPVLSQKAQHPMNSLPPLILSPKQMRASRNRTPHHPNHRLKRSLSLRHKRASRIHQQRNHRQNPRNRKSKSLSLSPRRRIQRRWAIARNAGYVYQDAVIRTCA